MKSTPRRRKPAGALGGVDVEGNAAAAEQPADGLDVGDGAGLVVDVHQRHEDGVAAQRRLHPRGGDEAVGAGRDAGDVEAVALEVQARVEDRLVLDGRGDDVGAAAGARGGRALDGEVVRLGGPGGPDDLAGVGVDEAGDVDPRPLDGLFGVAPEGVEPRRGVAEPAVRPEIAGHDRDDGRIGRRRRGMVHVDGRLHGAAPLSSSRAGRLTLHGMIPRSARGALA